MKFILASASPRRKELLHYILDDFDIICADADESIDDCVSPEQAAIEIACRKASAVKALPQASEAFIIAADTIVVLGDKIFGKPCDDKDAARMLNELSGKTHTVMTGVCLIAPNGRSLSFCDKTDVEFYKLGEKEIARYIATGEPMDKAGAYGIQGGGALLIKGIHGDYYNVMGLPIARLKRMVELLDVSL